MMVFGLCCGVNNCGDLGDFSGDVDAFVVTCTVIIHNNKLLVLY